MEAVVQEGKAHALLTDCSRIDHALPWKLAEQEAAQNSALFNACIYFRRYIPSACTRVFLGLPFGYFKWDIVVENKRIYEFAISQRFMCLSSGFHQRVVGEAGGQFRTNLSWKLTSSILGVRSEPCGEIGRTRLTSIRNVWEIVCVASDN